MAYSAPRRGHKLDPPLDGLSPEVLKFVKDKHPQIYQKYAELKMKTPPPRISTTPKPPPPKISTTSYPPPRISTTPKPPPPKISKTPKPPPPKISTTPKPPPPKISKTPKLQPLPPKIAEIPKPSIPPAPVVVPQPKVETASPKILEIPIQEIQKPEKKAEKIPPRPKIPKKSTPLQHQALLLAYAKGELDPETRKKVGDTIKEIHDTVDVYGVDQYDEHDSRAIKKELKRDNFYPFYYY